MNLKKEKTPIISGILFILVGLCMSIYFYKRSIVVGDLDFTTVCDFAFNLGTTLIGLGVITIVIDMPDWRKYFGDRVKEIVVDRKYINSLNENELTQLQVDIYKSLYKNTDIEKEDSFLQYMQNNIQGLISSPYREHVSSSCVISDCDDEMFLYKEKLSYTLRTMGRDQINDIVWLWTKNEIRGEASFIMTLKCPDFGNCSNKNCIGKSKCLDGKYTINLKQQVFGNEVGFKDKIANHVNLVDKLQVFLELEYKMKKNKLYTWKMANPTKDISINIIIPSTYEVDYFVGGLYEHEYIYRHNEDDNSIYFIRDGWMLPSDGLSFLFYKKQS